MTQFLTNLPPIVLSLNNITGYLPPTLPEKDFRALQSKFVATAPGMQYSHAYSLWKKTSGKKGWNGLTKFVTDSRSFGVGLLPEIIDWLSSRGYKVLLDDKRSVPVVNYGTISVELRDYQKEVVTKIVENTVGNTWWPRGVLNLVTGAGKTEIAVALYQWIPAKTLFLVNKKDLLVQTSERFLKYGLKSSLFGAGKKERKNNLTIATIQTINSFSKQNPEECKFWLSEFEQVFVDEAHDILSAKSEKGNTGIRILNGMPNAFFRWALTATAFDRDPYNSMSLKAVVGNAVATLSVTDLKANLSPIKFKMLEFKHDFTTPPSWPECLDIGIVKNDRRNQMIVTETFTLPKPLLVMTPRVEHAYTLAALMNTKGVFCKALTQETPLEERSLAVQELKNGKLDALVVTTIFDQGIDIPELQSILIAAGGKSRVKAIQRLGRALRKSQNKYQALIVDVVDRNHRILRRHATQRIEIWQEFGYDPKEPHE